jgi:hypothetical protein
VGDEILKWFGVIEVIGGWISRKVDRNQELPGISVTQLRHLLRRFVSTAIGFSVGSQREQAGAAILGVVEFGHRRLEIFNRKVAVSA